MAVKVGLFLPLAVLLVAVCISVSADRAYVEKIKGAPRKLGEMKVLPRARVAPKEAVDSNSADAGLLVCSMEAGQACVTEAGTGCAKITECTSLCMTPTDPTCQTCITAKCGAVAGQRFTTCITHCMTT